MVIIYQGHTKHKYVNYLKEIILIPLTNPNLVMVSEVSIRLTGPKHGFVKGMAVYQDLHLRTADRDCQVVPRVVR